ncbi:unnamed protein product [Linum trigynum]|uniref:Uncharacterized protein n=1 Tax=Linum trigynum TaxID=586398 RepID=A0AAV2D539_9ROSI
MDQLFHSFGSHIWTRNGLSNGNWLGSKGTTSRCSSSGTRWTRRAGLNEAAIGDNMPLLFCNICRNCVVDKTFDNGQQCDNDDI